MKKHINNLSLLMTICCLSAFISRVPLRQWACNPKVSLIIGICAMVIYSETKE